MEDTELAKGTMSIAESIAASGETDYLPVTFKSCDHVEGPFVHGTNIAFDVGDQLVSGYRSNYHEGRTRTTFISLRCSNLPSGQQNWPRPSPATRSGAASTSSSPPAPSKTTPTSPTRSSPATSHGPIELATRCASSPRYRPGKAIPRRHCGGCSTTSLGAIRVLTSSRTEAIHVLSCATP